MTAISADELGPEQPDLQPKWALTVQHPFPGLRPFAFPDHPFFFGREDQTYAVYRLLDRSRFIAVVGASGGGKSSLVRAGLLPLLEKESKGRGGRKWSWFELRPGDSPIDSLAAALCGHPEAEQDEFARAVFEAEKERIHYALNRSSFGLLDALGQLQLPKDRSVVLVIDQFEELFRFSAAEKATGRDPVDEMRRRDESAHFVQLLLEASRNSRAAVHVLITMRSDFIGDCVRYHGLPEAVSASQFLVPALTRDQREDIIRCPIERANAIIDPELVERLINDSNDEFDLPVLQHCLMRLWEEAGRSQPEPTDSASETDEIVAPDQVRRRHLKLSHYPLVGGIARALSKHAEEILVGLGGQDIAVEQTFRALSEVDKNGRATRRALTLERLCEETGMPAGQLRKVIDRFRADDCSFLVPSPSSVVELEPTTRVDVGHEALLRSWERISLEPKPGIESKRQVRREGWLWEEETDGRTYRALLNLIESDGSQTRVTLPLDQVPARLKWWTSRTRTPAWAERYGGGFERIQQLFDDSRSELEADRIRKQRAEANERDRVEQAARAELEAAERKRVEAEAGLLRIRARSTIAIAVLLAGLAAVTMALAYVSYTQRNEAVELRRVADQKRLEADQQREEADRQRVDAVKQRGAADAQRAEADSQRRTAEAERKEADLQRAAADRQRAETLALQSRFVASQSRKEVARGNTRIGLLLAQEAFKPLEQSGLPSHERPQDAEMALYMATTSVVPSQVLASIRRVDIAALSPDGKFLAAVSRADNVVRIWNREGKRVAEIPHKSWIRSVAFSQDGSRIVTASWDSTSKIWNASDGTITVLQHADDVNYASFSSTGEYVVTASDTDGHIWSTSGKKIATLRHPANATVYHAVFAPDGKRVVTSDGSVTRVWNTNGKRLFEISPSIEGDDRARSSIEKSIFSPDGKSVLVLSGDRNLRIWNNNGKKPRVISGHQDVVSDVVFNFDGSRFISVSNDQTAQLWDTEGLRPIATLRHEGAVLSAVFSRDGQRILTTSGDGTVRLWTSNGSKLGSLQLRENALVAGFELGGPGILTVAAGEFRIWDASRSGVELLIHPTTVSYAAFDRSGQRLLTLANDRTARVWTPGSNKFAAIGERNTGLASFVGSGNHILVRPRVGNPQLWSSEGNRLREFSEPEDFRSRVMDWERRRIREDELGLRRTEFASFEDGRAFLIASGESMILSDAEGNKVAEMPGTTARISPDGTRLVTASRDGPIVLWNASGEKILQLHEGVARRREGNKPSAPSANPSGPKEENLRLMSVDFSSDGKRVFAAYSSGFIQIWASDGTKIVEFESGGKISYAVPHPDGIQLAIVRPEGVIEFWSASRERVALMDQRIDPKIIPQFSPDGSRFLAVSRDKAAVLRHGESVRILRHDAPLQSATFSANGERILTTSSDGSVRIWDATGHKLAEISLEGRVSSASFNPDATRVLVTTVDSVARIFDLYSSEETRRLAADRKLDPLTNSERQRLLILEGVEEVRTPPDRN